jgi:hypothetical protein
MAQQQHQGINAQHMSCRQQEDNDTVLICFALLAWPYCGLAWLRKPHLPLITFKKILLSCFVTCEPLVLGPALAMDRIPA